MREQDKEGLFALVASVYAFYRVDCSPFALSIWLEAMRPYDLLSVKDGFNRHCVNPDNGQFLPKPADIVKLIGGGTKDGALLAWSKVLRAIGSVGGYQTVVFDDPLIHAVVSDMGGWVAMCSISVDETPFKANEFVTRYQGYRLRGSLPDVPIKLIGRADGENVARGLGESEPVLIGDKQAAKRLLTMKKGSFIDMAIYASGGA